MTYVHVFVSVYLRVCICMQILANGPSKRYCPQQKDNPRPIQKVSGYNTTSATLILLI